MCFISERQALKLTLRIQQRRWWCDENCLKNEPALRFKQDFIVHLCPLSMGLCLLLSVELSYKKSSRVILVKKWVNNFFFSLITYYATRQHWNRYRNRFWLIATTDESILFCVYMSTYRLHTVKSMRSPRDSITTKKAHASLFLIAFTVCCARSEKRWHSKSYHTYVDFTATLSIASEKNLYQEKGRS